MSISRNILLLNLVSFLKYSIIFLGLISLPKVKSNSVFRFHVKCSGRTTHTGWPRTFNNLYEKTQSAIINDRNGNIISKNYLDTEDGDSEITVTFEENINSYVHMFEDLGHTYYQEIILRSFTNSKPESMRRMFYGSSFRKIIFENIDASLVTEMNSMFESCYNLEEVDISTLNIASATTMNYMFKNCGNLKKVTLPKFDAPKLLDMSYMFENCKQLEKVDLSYFKTPSVTSMNSTFRYCEGLKEINLRNFDTSKVTDMDYLFESCKSLEEIDLSSFSTSSVVSMNSTFRHCENLKVIDARNFDTSKVTNMYDVFGYCYKLVYINVSSFNTQSLKVMQGMFINCYVLKYIDIHQFYYDTLVNSCGTDTNHDWCRYHYMFAFCKLLKCLNFETFYYIERLDDNTFNEIPGDIKFCVNENNIHYKKDWIKNSCNDQCFKDMETKKFDVSQNEYVDECNSNKFDFNDLCWDDCPYHYYRIFTDRKTCSKEEPGENFFYDSTDNIYYQCYSTCKTCSARGNEENHNCDTCIANYLFISTSEDKYAVEKNCYEVCNNNYYFDSTHGYYCGDACPTTFKLIEKKNKCIDFCTNDNTYIKEYDNKCITTCPKGTFDDNNICKNCYNSCGDCDGIGDKKDHKCTECISGYDFLLKNKNCYDICNNYYYFDNNGEYVCLKENKCPPGYKLIDSTNKCIEECQFDTIFNSIYEYNGGCYTEEKCTKGTYEKDNKMFCKCMKDETCESCTESAQEKNLCSTCDIKNGYYPKKEESNMEYKKCYNSGTIDANYLFIASKNYYESCYPNCATCEAISTSIKEQKCLSCKEGFSDLNRNNKNCYEICTNYYYFDSSDNYNCLNEKKCPNDYKLLIVGTNKCIDQCKKDNIFNSIYEYNGGCYTEEKCTKGTYEKDNKMFCKCMKDETCESCTESAQEKNLCSTCDIKNGYYPKKEESNMEYKKCYNSGTIDANYLLVGTNYEKCYKNCATCDGIGETELDQKCSSCIAGHSDLNNNKNCYSDCAHYYYFNDEGKYICLDHDECPENYKYLIDGKNKCIDECKNDNIFNYIYEYNGGCYSSCEKGDYEIGEGENKKKICKCETNDACKDCPKSKSGNNLCSSCNDGYYPKEDETKNDGLFNCYNSKSIPTNYFLNKETSQWERCYESCGSCNEKGTSESDQRCKDCKDETYKKLNNDNNCYPICNEFYYFNENKEYKCESKCPPGYKLIDGTNKCIDECKNDNIFNSIYEYNGGCYKEENCKNGHYVDENGKKFCKCMSNISCKDCPSENNVNNLCSICDSNFYPIKGEKENYLKNCYDDTTIPSNYIFNSEESQYEPCYESCQECETIGTSDSHQCKSCKNGYKPDNEHSGNCVQQCTYFFYYVGTELKCTEAEACPENYKLVDSSTKCVQNCKAENLYDYNNICYSSCKNGHYTDGDEDYCKCKTNIACKVCSSEDTDLCDSCNTDEKYYPMKDDDSNNNGLIKCYNSESIPTNYFLNKEASQWERCYESCGSCNEKGTSESDQRCKDCKDETYKKLNNDNNCYPICNEFYYFNENKEYKCESKCPPGYKLIDGTNKCIDECKNDNIFNSIYEYNGGCYKECPNGFYTEGEGENEKQKCKCMSNISCKDCPSENNDDNLCSICNIDKNYYPIEGESTNTYKHCYNVTTKPSNYILISGEYKMCYPSCKTCDIISKSDSDHKCKECLDGFTKLQNNDNCYETCQNYYYFDDENDDKYVCLDVKECPDKYKLIYGTNQCIKNCGDINKYEYNGICYPECPEYWTDTFNDHICKLNCPGFNMYFNYLKTNCINEIPKGYYLANEDEKILGKCHDNCFECSEGPTGDNNNCLKCPNTGTIYFDWGNCLETCINGNFIEDSVKKCKCLSNIQCQICDENGNCFSCNNDEGYYPIEGNDEEGSNIIECVKDPEGYYLSQDSLMYKKCYEKCKYCTDVGEDKCIECKDQYEFRNDFVNDKKCYEKCRYNYYYDEDNNNKCTPDTNCPIGMKFIEPKKRCIDQCKNDNKYTFEYNGICYEHCPEETRMSSADNNICEDIPEDTVKNTEETEECNLKFNDFDYLFNDTLTNEDLNSFTTLYASKYGKSDNYITKLENEYFKIFIYNNILCLEKVSQDAKLVDFGDNFLNLLSNKQIVNPILAIVEDKKTNSTSYAVAEPNSGELLEDVNNDLRRTEIHVLEDIYSSLSYLGDIKRKYIIHMLKQGIDVFDPNNKFYTNLCFYYDSPNDKDIPMKDRPYFYADLPKCDSDCTYQGIDYTNLKFKCQCTFRTLSDGDSVGDAPSNFDNGYPKKKNSPNIEVFKCMGHAFKGQYFKKSSGGIIMLILSAVQITCMTLYLLMGISKIKKHTFSLYSAYKNYTGKNMKNDANPPKKNISNNKNKITNKEVVTSSKLNLKKDLILVNAINNNKKSDKYNSNKNKKDNKKITIDVDDIKDLNEIKEKVTINNDMHENTQNKTEEKFEKLEEKNSNFSNESIIVDKIYTEMIQEFLDPDFDENDFDDVITKDRRTFLQFFAEKAFENQIFIKTFLIKHIFKPLFLKIMLLVLYIELYFVISALFYSEGYFSERFYSDEKEHFLSFVSKRIDEIIFTLIICGIIQYFCSYFFDNDDYLRRIFTNKINMEMDLALADFTKNIKRKFIILIVISMIVTIFAFLYITSFNVVYPYIKDEWVTCSLLILILMQIINLISTLLGTCCRYLSIKWNNIKLFRLSLNLD